MHTEHGVIPKIRSDMYVRIDKYIQLNSCTYIYVIACMHTEHGVVSKNRSYMYVYIYIQISSCTYICHSMYAHRTWSYTEDQKLYVGTNIHIFK